MKKKSAAAVIAALIVVALGFFASFFLSFTDGKDEKYTITLPGQGSAVIDTNPEMEQSNRDQLQTVQVDRSNVQAVIARLQRPASYQYQAETSYFYRESKTVLRSQVWKEDTRTRISQFTADGEPGQQILLTESWVYLWGMEGAYVRYTRQTQDADLYSRAPSYEDILNMSADQVLEGGTAELDGRLCLYVKTLDERTGETVRWYVLAENGLLCYAEGSLDGRTTYEVRITDLQPEGSEYTTFLLPDGTQPE